MTETQVTQVTPNDVTMHTYDSEVWGDGRVILDLQLGNVLNIQRVPQLNGYVGDDGREVIFKLVNGRDAQGNRKIMRLDDKYIALSIVDANGVPKILENFYRIDDAKGEFGLRVPQAFYAAAGQIKEGIIDVFDDDTYTHSIGSVKVAFEVYNRQLAVAIGEGAGDAFHSAIGDLQRELNAAGAALDEQLRNQEANVNRSIADQTTKIDGVNANIDTSKQNFELVVTKYRAMVDELMAKIDAGHVVDVSSDQNILGLKGFDKLTAKQGSFEVLNGYADGIKLKQINNASIDFNDPQPLLGQMKPNQHKVFGLWKHTLTNDPFDLSRLFSKFGTTSVVLADVVTFENTQVITLTNRDDGATYQRWYYIDGGHTPWRTLYYDSGFRDLVPYLDGNNFKKFSDAQAPLFRIFGNTISFIGAITPKKKLDAGADNVAITNLPIRFPWGAANLINGTGVATLSAFATGNQIVLTRQRNEAGWLDFELGQWINLGGIALPIQ